MPSRLASRTLTPVTATHPLFAAIGNTPLIELRRASERVNAFVAAAAPTAS